MKTVWLTHYQLKMAQLIADTINNDSNEIDVAISSFREIDLQPVGLAKYPYFITLRFRKTAKKWELVTPVQVVDEWLARQMQTLTD